MKGKSSFAARGLSNAWDSFTDIFNFGLFGASGDADNVSLRWALRRVVLAWVFGAAWMYIVTGAAFTRYAELIGVSVFGFGVLAAIAFIGPIIQLPGSLILERYGHRKEILIWTCALHRFLWIVIAALPWILPHSLQWPALLVVMLISSLLANISAPAWMSWMADLVPDRIRGRYFSRRIQIGQGVGLVLSLLTGLALDWPSIAPKVLPHLGISFECTPEQQTHILRIIISSLFTLAGILGIIDILLFIRVPDHKARLHHRHQSLRELFIAPLANPDFRRFLGYSALMTFATGYMGQFIWLYLFDEVGMSNMKANIILVAIPMIITASSFPMWGRIVDRYGSKHTLLAAGLLVINGATSWMLITREHFVLGYIGVIIATMAWPGMELGSLNILLRMTSSSSKGRSGTSIIAINSFVTSIAGTLSGFFGGAVAAYLGKDWHSSLLWLPVSYHGVLFIISAVLRAASLLFLIPLKEDKKGAPQDALRYMATTVYSNLQQATFFPVRMLVTAAKYTWRLPLGKSHHGKKN